MSNVEQLVRVFADGIVADVAERVAAQLVAQAKTAGVKEWLTPPEAAEYLGQKPTTLEIQRCTGKGPRFYKLGRNAVRYKRSDLDEYLSSDPHNSTSAPLPKPKPKAVEKRGPGRPRKQPQAAA